MAGNWANLPSHLPGKIGKHYCSKACAVLDCKKVVGRGVSSFICPESAEVRSKWVEFVRQKRKGWNAPQWFRVCSDHFDLSHFKNYRQYHLGLAQKLLLEPDAYPTLRPTKTPQDLEEATVPGASGSKNRTELSPTRTARKGKLFKELLSCGEDGAKKKKVKRHQGFINGKEIETSPSWNSCKNFWATEPVWVQPKREKSPSDLRGAECVEKEPCSKSLSYEIIPRNGQQFMQIFLPDGSYLEIELHEGSGPPDLNKHEHYSKSMNRPLCRLAFEKSHSTALQGNLTTVEEIQHETSIFSSQEEIVSPRSKTCFTTDQSPTTPSCVWSDRSTPASASWQSRSFWSATNNGSESDASLDSFSDATYTPSSYQKCYLSDVDSIPEWLDHVAAFTTIGGENDFSQLG